MSKLPDFEGLAMFAKVAEERSFAAAARVTGLSVATVSRSVARLEDRLGGRLINRTSRRLALTDLGRNLADRAARLYTDAEDAENLARETSSQPRGVVRLAVPMSFGVRWVAPILPDFFRAYPKVSVDLHLTDDKIDLIGDGFDAAVRIAVLADSSLVARKIATVRRLHPGRAELHSPLRPSAASRRSRRPFVSGIRLARPGRRLAFRGRRRARGDLHAGRATARKQRRCVAPDHAPGPRDRRTPRLHRIGTRRGRSAGSHPPALAHG